MDNRKKCTRYMFESANNTNNNKYTSEDKKNLKIIVFFTFFDSFLAHHSMIIYMNESIYYNIFLIQFDATKKKNHRKNSAPVNIYSLPLVFFLYTWCLPWNDNPLILFFVFFCVLQQNWQNRCQLFILVNK